MNNVARWMILAAVGTACVEQPPNRRGGGGISAQEVEAVRRRVTSTTRPNPQHALTAQWGNKLTLLGYDISPAEVRPGTNVTITWYWHCDATTGDGWRLFTHLDDHNGPRANHDGDGDARRAYQPERWRRGEYITDRQTFEIPADWESPVVRISLGVWREGEQSNNGRMPLTRGTAGPDGRFVAITLPTGVQIRVAELDVPQLAGAITIDGQLNEPAWQTAGRTGPLVNPGSGAPAGPSDAHGSVRVLWDSTSLYLGWEVSDENIIETGTDGARDAHYWDNDTTEVLIDPDGDGHNYYEIQVSPGNHSFDSQQANPPSGTNFGNVAWNPGLRSAVVRNGTLGNEGDTDTGYSVEVAIPFADINAGAAHTPPTIGDQWRVNFFLMDKPRQGGVRHAAWSAPRGGNFHATDRFGRITFRGPSQAAAPPTVEPIALPAPSVAPTAAPGAGARPAPAGAAVPTARPAPAAHAVPAPAAPAAAR